MKTAINKSKNISLDKFIFSIGIRHIGQENAKILAAFFTSIDKFLNLFNEKKREQILKNLVELDRLDQPKSTQLRISVQIKRMKR